MAMQLHPLQSSFQGDLTCGQVLHQNPNRTAEELCSALNATSGCYFVEGFVNYVILIYCHFQGVEVLGTILMFVWFLVMLVGLAATVDAFFGPCLIVISDTLRLSQNLAGVTLLALGNGAPDIFASISAVNNIKGGDAGLAFGFLLGGGIYISCMTTGVIAFMKTFKAMSRPLVKDLVFLLFVTFCTFVIIFNRKIELWQAIGFILLYIVYVIVTVGSQALYTRGCGRGPDGVDDGEIKDVEDESGTQGYRRRSDCDLPAQLPPVVSVSGMSNPAFVYTTVDRTGGAGGQLGGEYDDSIEPGQLRRVDPSELGEGKQVRPARRRFEALNVDSSPKISETQRPSRMSMRMARVSRVQQFAQPHKLSAAAADGVISGHSSGPASRKTSTADFTGISRRANYLARWMLVYGNMENVEHRSRAGTSAAQQSRSNSVVTRERRASSVGRQRTVSQVQRWRSDSSASGGVPTQPQQPPAVETSGRLSDSNDSGTNAPRDLYRIDSVDEALDDESLEKLNRINRQRDAGAEAGVKAEESTAGEDKEAEATEQPGSALKEFLFSVCPVDIRAFPSMTWYNKAYEIVKAPLLFLLLITTPLVDYDQPMNGWSRILNSIHCITAPLYIGAALSGWTWYIGSVPVLPLLPAAGLLLGALVFFTSSDFQPPRYHNVFSFVGFLTAIIWIYTFANEIINVLESAGHILRISSTILGLTVLAWANCVGDMIANSLMARQNFPRVAISACFGGPLFNILLGIGIPFALKLIANNREDGVEDYAMVLVVSEVEVMLCAFMALSMLVSMVVLTITDYHVTRAYGVVLVVVYVVFLVVVLITEQGLIKFL